MKIIALILSFYILTLNFAPCEDTVVLDSDFKTELSQDLGLDHNHAPTDLCTPFCICQCCHITVTNFKYIYAKPQLTFTTFTHTFFYKKGLDKNITTSILQPPRHNSVLIG